MLSATRMLSVIPTHTGQPSDVPDEFGAPLDLTPDPARMAALRPQVIDALRTVFDPEIPVNIYDLGLIYDLEVDDTVAAQGVVALLLHPALDDAEVPRPPVVVEDDFPVEILQAVVHANTLRTSWSAVTS